MAEIRLLLDEEEASRSGVIGPLFVDDLLESFSSPPLFFLTASIALFLARRESRRLVTALMVQVERCFVLCRL